MASEEKLENENRCPSVADMIKEAQNRHDKVRESYAYYYPPSYPPPPVYYPYHPAYRNTRPYHKFKRAKTEKNYKRYYNGKYNASNTIKDIDYLKGHWDPEYGLNHPKSMRDNGSRYPDDVGGRKYLECLTSGDDPMSLMNSQTIANSEYTDHYIGDGGIEMKRENILRPGPPGPGPGPRSRPPMYIHPNTQMSESSMQSARTPIPYIPIKPMIYSQEQLSKIPPKIQGLRAKIQELTEEALDKQRKEVGRDGELIQPRISLTATEKIAIILWAQDTSVESAAAFFSLHPGSIRRWTEKMKEKGIEGLSIKYKCNYSEEDKLKIVNDSFLSSVRTASQNSGVCHVTVSKWREQFIKDGLSKLGGGGDIGKGNGDRDNGDNGDNGDGDGDTTNTNTNTTNNNTNTNTNINGNSRSSAQGDGEHPQNGIYSALSHPPILNNSPNPPLNLPLKRPNRV